MSLQRNDSAHNTDAATLLAANGALGARWVDALNTRLGEAIFEIYHPEFRHWTNVTLPGTKTPAPEKDLKEVRALGKMEREQFAHQSLDDLRIQPTLEGFVVQAVMNATLFNGVKISGPLCIVMTVRDGLLVREEAYLNPETLSPSDSI